jgi:hypothetical protein
MRPKSYKKDTGKCCATCGHGQSYYKGTDPPNKWTYFCGKFGEPVFDPADPTKKVAPFGYCNQYITQYKGVNEMFDGLFDNLLGAMFGCSPKEDEEENKPKGYRNRILDVFMEPMLEKWKHLDRRIGATEINISDERLARLDNQKKADELFADIGEKLNKLDVAKATELANKLEKDLEEYKDFQENWHTRFDATTGQVETIRGTVDVLAKKVIELEKKNA